MLTLPVCTALQHRTCLADAGVLLQYLVKRKGLDFTECGMVDARVAKRQRLQQPGADEAPQSPVSIAMVDEWERFQKSFRCAVHAHNDGGELDLGMHLPLYMLRFTRAVAGSLNSVGPL